MNHYCTYFDRGFLIQGLALWRSLTAHDADAVLWVLAFDDETANLLRSLDEPRLRVVRLAELEAADPELASTRSTRSLVEYYFTASPCWLWWLLKMHPEITRLTYVDADLFFFSSPTSLWAGLEGVSVLLTAHRFQPWQRHLERYGRHNKGCLAFRNNMAALACLEDWRTRCLAWCRDQPSEGRYADQGYLTDWPERFGSVVRVLDHPGVNLAPWNWQSYALKWDEAGRPRFDGRPLVAFHFSRFTALCGDWWWRSGQLDYGVMPWRLRQSIYGPYWTALKKARSQIGIQQAGVDFVRGLARQRSSTNKWARTLVFGGNWLQVGGYFISGRFGLGRWSGRIEAWFRQKCRRPAQSSMGSANTAER